MRKGLMTSVLLAFLFLALPPRARGDAASDG